MEKYELLALLQAHHIPLDEWGAGEAKTFDHLLKEVASGEAIVYEDAGTIFRSVQNAVLMVYYTDGSRTWWLKEDRQVFKDGREKRRALEKSIGEKMRPGEAAIDAGYRALREELKITERLELTPKPPLIKGPVPSQSYPGLMTCYVMNVFVVFLPPHLYKPEGYVEKQEDKTNYFVWIEVRTERKNILPT